MLIVFDISDIKEDKFYALLQLCVEDYFKKIEEGAVLSAFAYEEKKGTFNEAYDHITEILSSTFSVKQIKSEPYEITMADFYDCWLEARRANYGGWGRIISLAHLKFYENYYRNELSNIESHPNTSEFNCNMAHHLISSKSVQAANDITEALMQRLVNANRLNSIRMEIISQIDPDMYKGHNYIEELIEKNTAV